MEPNADSISAIFGENLKTICIVEDEVLIAQDLEFLLEENGHDVCSIACDCKSALKAAEDFKPDYFLMDINVLGDIDGIEIACLIQEIHKTHIIFHSSDAISQHIERLKKIKCLDYIEKPMSNRILLELLDKNLSVICQNL